MSENEEQEEKTSKDSSRGNFADQKIGTGSENHVYDSFGNPLQGKLFDALSAHRGEPFLRENDPAQFIYQDKIDPEKSIIFNERMFSKYNGLELRAAKNRIETPQDVAYLFKALEDEAVEQLFLVHRFKDDSFMVQHVSTGGVDQALADFRLMVSPILEMHPAHLYLVHNHPSGNLRSSRQDRNLLHQLRESLRDTGIEVEDGIIMNLRSGKFLTFSDTKDEQSDINHHYDVSQEGYPVQSYSFSKQLFKQDYQPSKVTAAEDVAAFLSTQRFGLSEKRGLIVLNQANNITAKIILSGGNSALDIATHVSKFGGVAAIFFGSQDFYNEVKDYNKELKRYNINILDNLIIKRDQSRDGHYFVSSIFGGQIGNDTYQAAVGEHQQKYQAAPNRRNGTNFDELQINENTYDYFVSKGVSPEYLSYTDREELNEAIPLDLAKRFLEEAYELGGTDEEISEFVQSAIKTTIDKGISSSKEYLSYLDLKLNYGTMSIEGYSFEELQALPIREVEGMKRLAEKEFKYQVANDYGTYAAVLQRQVEFLNKLINQKKQTFNNQNNNIMPTMDNQQQNVGAPKEEKTAEKRSTLDILSKQLLYMGFSLNEEQLKELTKGISGKDKNFSLNTSSNRSPFSNQMNYQLNFGKTDDNRVFFNSYNASLVDKRTGEEKNHTFHVHNKNNITAKEALNLLEGRSVKTKLQSKATGQLEDVFLKLKLKDDKTEYGNYQIQVYNKEKYGVDTSAIVKNSPLTFKDDAHRMNTIKSLEKGNLVNATFNIGNKPTKGFAMLNPQYKSLNIYDGRMARINTSKPETAQSQNQNRSAKKPKQHSVNR